MNLNKVFTSFTLLFLWSSGLGAEQLILERIAFGSCCRQTRPMPIFKAVNKFKPQLWIWMGDNVYGDTTNMAKLESKYKKLLSNKFYSKLDKSTPIIGTWDDHDYGENDAGKEFSKKEESQQKFLDFFRVAQDDPRRKQKGVYSSSIYGPKGKQVKVILLDTRYHRDEPGIESDVLGEDQWDWLERELQGSEAQVNLLVSSIQVVPSEHEFEKWANFPAAKKRFMQLLSREDIPAVTILSGDRHLAEISVEKKLLPYELYEITSSSLNTARKSDHEKNTSRVGENYGCVNFGTLEIDWRVSPPNLSYAIRDVSGEIVRSIELKQR